MNNYGDCLEAASELESDILRLEGLLAMTEETASKQAGEIQKLRYQVVEHERQYEVEKAALFWILDNNLTICISPPMNMRKEDSEFSAALASKPSTMWKALVVVEESFWNRNFRFRSVTEAYGWSYLDLLQDVKKRVQEIDMEIITENASRG